MKSEMKRIIALAVCVVLGIVAALVTPPESWGLSAEGFKTILILLIAIVLWCTEAMPTLVTSMIVLVLLWAFGVLDLNAIWAATGTNGVFFLLAAFGMATAVTHTNVPRVLLRGMLKITGNNTKKILFGFICIASFVSMFIATGAAICIVSGFALGMMKSLGDPEPGTSNLGRGLMIGVTWGGLCGGIAMPISNIVNVLGISILQGYGYDITFVQWAIIGIPLAIVFTLFIAWFCCWWFKPEALSDDQYKAVQESVNDAKMGANEIKLIVIFVGMMYFWIFTNVNMVITGMVGVTLMFLPGINIITGKQFVEGININAVLIIMAVMALVAGVQATGVGDWIVSTCFVGVETWPIVVIVLMVSIVTMLVHTVMPVGAACFAVVGAIMFPLAASVGLSCAGIAVLLAWWAGVLFYMPIEAVYMMTYGHGYWTFGECVKGGIIPTVVTLVVAAAWIPIISGLLGMA